MRNSCKCAGVGYVHLVNFVLQYLLHVSVLIASSRVEVWGSICIDLQVHHRTLHTHTHTNTRACLPARCSGVRYSLCLQLFVSSVLVLMYVYIIYHLFKLKITVRTCLLYLEECVHACVRAGQCHDQYIKLPSDYPSRGTRQTFDNSRIVAF
jgi:hypothetical protein